MSPFFYRNICHQFSLFREVNYILVIWKRKIKHFDYLRAKNKT